MGRWTDLCPFLGPVPYTSGDGDGRAGEPEDRRRARVRGVIWHTADGTFEGTKAWQRNRISGVSSTFVCAKRREHGAAQMVDTDDRQWTQGAGNDAWLSIENEGFGEALTDWQIEFGAMVLARSAREYGHAIAVASNPLVDEGLGHHSMGAEHGLNWGHDQCPGPIIIGQKPRAVALAREIAQEGADMARLWLVKLAGGNGQVWRTPDLTIRTPLWDEADLAGVIWQAEHNGVTIATKDAHGGYVAEVDNLDAFGEPLVRAGSKVPSDG